jgi:hypothetical protein
MCGMPCASRITLTGAFTPATLSEPSSCGREDFAIHTNATTTTVTASSRRIMIALRMRAVLERCVLGGERVTVAMELVRDQQNIVLASRIKPL